MEDKKHGDMAKELGWPLWLVHWHEELAEALPASEMSVVRAAVPVGAGEEETERWRHAIAVKRLHRLLQTQQSEYVKTAIEQAISYHANPNRTEAMRMAAAKLAWAALEEVAYSAWWETESAAQESSEPVDRSVWWSARVVAEAEAAWATRWSVWEEPETPALSVLAAARSSRYTAASATDSAVSQLAAEASLAEYRAELRAFLDVVTTKEPE